MDREGALENRVNMGDNEMEAMAMSKRKYAFFRVIWAALDMRYLLLHYIEFWQVMWGEMHHLFKKLKYVRNQVLLEHKRQQSNYAF